MITKVQGAELVLVAGPGPGGSRSLSGQTVEIHKAGTQAVIGIDGHTSFWDELVEVRWLGSHLEELEPAGHVEIRDGEGRMLESLPVNRTRRAWERDGETVFFLTDAE